MWGGRFAEGPSAVMREINASIPFDKALWRQDIAASKAHVAMLGATGIVSTEDAKAIEGGLDQVAAEFEKDGVPEDWALEDIHMTVEGRLAELIEVTPPGGELSVLVFVFSASALQDEHVERHPGSALEAQRDAAVGRAP